MGLRRLILLQWGYIAAMLVALAVLLRTRVRVPMFLLYVAAGLAFMLTQPNIARWHLPAWMEWQRVLMVLRFACCAEILWKMSGGLKARERSIYLLIEVLIPAGIVYAAWHTDAPLAVFRHAESGIAVCILLALLVRWDLGGKDDGRQRLAVDSLAGGRDRNTVPVVGGVHAALFCLLMMNRVTGLMLWHPGMSAADWLPIMALSYSVGIALFSAWAMFVREKAV